MLLGDQQVRVDGQPDQEERGGHWAEVGDDTTDERVQAVSCQLSRWTAAMQGLSLGPTSWSRNYNTINSSLSQRGEIRNFADSLLEYRPTEV